MTENKNNPQANKSLVMQKPNTKYATVNTDKSKSDIFVLEECSRGIIFIFLFYFLKI